MQFTYEGREYRSRLVANWALFLDLLEIEHEARQASYKGTEAGAYSADFYLSAMDLFVGVFDDDASLVSQLSPAVKYALDNDYRLVVCIGAPGEEKMFLIDRTTCNYLEAFAEEFANPISPDEATKRFLEQLEEDSAVILGHSPLSQGWTLVFRGDPVFVADRIREAVQEMKAAKL